VPASAALLINVARTSAAIGAAGARNSHGSAAQGIIPNRQYDGYHCLAGASQFSGWPGSGGIYVLGKNDGGVYQPFNGTLRA